MLQCAELGRKERGFAANLGLGAWGGGGDLDFVDGCQSTAGALEWVRAVGAAVEWALRALCWDSLISLGQGVCWAAGHDGGK